MQASLNDNNAILYRNFVRQNLPILLQTHYLVFSSLLALSDGKNLLQTEYI